MTPRDAAGAAPLGRALASSGFARAARVQAAVAAFEAWAGGSGDRVKDLKKNIVQLFVDALVDDAPACRNAAAAGTVALFEGFCGGVVETHACPRRLLLAAADRRFWGRRTRARRPRGS